MEKTAVLFNVLRFIKNLVSLLNKDKTTEINGYTLEVKGDRSVYRTAIQDKEELSEIIKTWYFYRKQLNISKYEKVLDL